MVNSDFLNDLKVDEAKKEIIEKIEKLKIGQRKISYRLKIGEYRVKDIEVALFQ